MGNNATAAVPELPPEEPPKRRRQPARQAAPIVPDLENPGETKKLTRTPKAAEWEIAHRRRDVRRLRMRGKTYKEVAEELNVSPQVVLSDIKAIEEQAKGRIDPEVHQHLLSQTLQAFDDVIENAWDEFYSLSSGAKQRISALEVIRSTAHDRMKVALEVGLVARAETAVKHTHQVLPWTDELKQATIETLLRSRLRPQMLLPTPDDDHVPGRQPETVIDAEVVAPPAAEPPPAPVPPGDPGAVERAEAALRRLVNSGMSLEAAKETIAAEATREPRE